jgi:hypothetical protein
VDLGTTRAVAARVAAFADVARMLRTFVVEDRPADPDHDSDHKALADLADAADDLVDVTSHAVWALDPARVGSTSLGQVHLLVLDASRVLNDDLLAVDRRFDEARRAVHPWGPSWRAWSRVVLSALLEARDALAAAQRSVADAWISAKDSSAARHEPVPVPRAGPQREASR